MAPLFDQEPVYVIENPSGKLYIGLSEDVTERLQQHNYGVSKWTKGKGPWSLLWTSEAMSLSDARKLENHLKKQKGGNGLRQYLALHPGSESRLGGIVGPNPTPATNFLVFRCSKSDDHHSMSSEN